MKSSPKRKLLVSSAILVFAVPGLQAATITGIINFSTEATFDNADLSVATSIVSWDNPATVTKATQSFSGVPEGSAATFQAPYALTYAGAPKAVWAVGGFTFYITDSFISSVESTEIRIKGSGFITGPGFDPTYALWDFSNTVFGEGASYSITASNIGSGVAVPDGGTTLALLGVGLLGLGGIRRHLRRA